MDVAKDRKSRVQIYPGRHELAGAAVANVARLWEKAHDKRGRFTIALSGGTLMEILSPPLLEEPLPNEIAWCGWHVFWADERCVPHSRPASN